MTARKRPIVEDTFHKVILKAGKFDACYFDNGSQYIAKQLKLSLAKLGIRIRHAPVRSGKSKGKQEKFHQVVDAFLREVRLKKVKTLEELNRYWDIYLNEYYHNKSHDGIAEVLQKPGQPRPCGGDLSPAGMEPGQPAAYFLDTTVVAEAFLHHEERLVDKGEHASTFRAVNMKRNRL